MNVSTKMLAILLFFIAICGWILDRIIINERMVLKTERETLESKIGKLETKVIDLQNKLDDTRLITCSIGNQVTRIADIIIYHAEADDTNTPREIKEMGKVEELQSSDER